MKYRDVQPINVILFRISDSRYDDYDRDRRSRYDDAPLDDYPDSEDYTDDDSEDDGA